jgi:hypothetical protein
VLATTLISGTGLAPQVALLPGLLSTIQSATANFGVYGVAVDASGTIYYSDQLGGKVFKIVNGVTATLPFTGLMAPQQLAVDGAGSVYLLDGGARIMKLDTNGVQSTLVSSANFPFGLTVITSFAVGGQGGVYMTGPSVDFGGLVAKLGAGGDFGLIGSDFADLQALALGPGTTVYVVDFIANSGTSTLYSITPTGAQDTVATGLPCWRSGLSTRELRGAPVRRRQPAGDRLPGGADHLRSARAGYLHSAGDGQ